MAGISIAIGYMMTILGGLIYIASVLRALYVPEAQNPDVNVWTRSLTALIPAGFGLLFILLGAIAARSRSERTRMHVMHGAATLGLVGLVMPLVMLVIMWVQASRGKNYSLLTLTEMVVMAILSGIFLILCIKSFVDVRRARKAAEAHAVR